MSEIVSDFGQNVCGSGGNGQSPCKRKQRMIRIPVYVEGNVKIFVDVPEIVWQN